ncbi:MAG: hypothetical protein ACOCXD_01950 [Bacteroidota bacterium]
MESLIVDHLTEKEIENVNGGYADPTPGETPEIGTDEWFKKFMICW